MNLNEEKNFIIYGLGKRGKTFYEFLKEKVWIVCVKVFVIKDI